MTGVDAAMATQGGPLAGHGGRRGANARSRRRGPSRGSPAALERVMQPSHNRRHDRYACCLEIPRKNHGAGWTNRAALLLRRDLGPRCRTPRSNPRGIEIHQVVQGEGAPVTANEWRSVFQGSHWIVRCVSSPNAPKRPRSKTGGPKPCSDITRAPTERPARYFPALPRNDSFDDIALASRLTDDLGRASREGGYG